MTQARVIKRRVVYPHTLYVDSARYFQDQIRKEEYPSWFDLIACMTLTALSIEAIANSFGAILVPNYSDFESSSPFAKIRIICEKLGIDVDPNIAPFNDLKRVLKVRNKLAHPKYKSLELTSDLMSVEDATKLYNDGDLLHEIEKALNPELVEKSLASVMKIEQLILKKSNGALPMESSERKIEIKEES